MKRFVAIAAVAFFAIAAGDAMAFAVSKGIKGGINIASLDGDDVDSDLDSRNGIVGGAFFSVPVVPALLSIQPEILFSQKGAAQSVSLQNASYDAKFKLDYIEVPVLAKLGLPVLGGFKPYAGPSFGVEMSAKISCEGDLCDEDGLSEGDTDIEDTKGVDVGAAIGGMFEIPTGAGHFLVDVRYTMGLNSVYDTDPEKDTKNRTVSVMAGVGFN